MNGKRLLHVAIADDWEACGRFGEYEVSTRATSLDATGFIHAATGPQLATVLAEVYGDMTLPLTVVVIDEEALVGAGIEIRWVPSRRSGEHFAAVPRIMGPLPMDAPVVAALISIEPAGNRLPTPDLTGLNVRTSIPVD